jgi:hypothetical protein
MTIDDVFTSTAPGCRLIIDTGLPPWDGFAMHGALAGRLTVAGMPPNDELGGELVDEWAAAMWEHSFRDTAAALQRLHLDARSERMPMPALVGGGRRPADGGDGAALGNGHERYPMSGGGPFGPVPFSWMFKPFPPAQLRIRVTHGDPPTFTVTKLDDNATLRFTRRASQDFGQALDYESGDLGGTWMRVILIDDYVPLWES